MSQDGLNETKTSYISSLISLFASSSTLICCAGEIVVPHARLILNREMPA